MPKCVVFSERAFTSILIETQEKISTETGGVFLGYRNQDIWYIIESIDPGPNSIFRSTYFEYDQNYVNHLINKVAKLYANQPDLIGLWHRHPGSFDSFSRTDDITNTRYCELNDHGAISALVNIDPQFRLTMYSVSLPLKYEKIKIIVGDSYVPRRMLELKNKDILKRQIEFQFLSKDSTDTLNNIDFKDQNQSLSFKEARKKDEHKEISFHEVIFWFLNQRTYGNVRNPELKLSNENKDNAVALILEMLESDLDFLEQLGITCQLNISSSGTLILKESDNMLPQFEIAFGLNDNQVFFLFNECCYKYQSNLFKKAYVEYLLKEGEMQ